jgi:hypothetical protein
MTRPPLLFATPARVTGSTALVAALAAVLLVILPAPGRTDGPAAPADASSYEVPR